MNMLFKILLITVLSILLCVILTVLGILLYYFGRWFIDIIDNKYRKWEKTHRQQ